MLTSEVPVRMRFSSSVLVVTLTMLSGNAGAAPVDTSEGLAPGNATAPTRTRAVKDPTSAAPAGVSQASGPDAEPPSASEWEPAMTEALPAHHWRSLEEMGIGLALGTFLYWAFYNRNIADWDDPRIRERFNGRAWRFDNNSLGVNYMAHGFEGAGAYHFARGNHHGPLVAFAYASLTSFLWEFVLEFREKVSVNDLITTSPAGVPIGEFFHKLGLYLDSGAESGGVASALGWLLGPGAKLDRALDGREPPHVVSYDNLGLSRKIWHQFDLGYAWDFVRSPGVETYHRHRAMFSGRLATLPGYLGPRTFARGFSRAELTHLSIMAVFSPHGAGLELTADTMLAGYHVQRMSGTPGHALGVAGTFGTSMGYNFLFSQANESADVEAAARLPAPDLPFHVPITAEQYAGVHFPGPEVNFHVRLPEFAASVRARAHPSFASLNAPAFYDFAAAHLEDELKRVIHRQGYFYGWGGTGFIEGELRAGPLSLTGHASYGRYHSQQGLDRYVEEVTNDVVVDGDLLRYGASAELRVPRIPVSLGVGYDVRRLRSWVGDFERRGRSAAYSLVGGLHF